MLNICMPGLVLHLLNGASLEGGGGTGQLVALNEVVLEKASETAVRCKDVLC